MIKVEALLANERIALREFRESDWEGVHSYASRGEVCRYQSWGPNTEAESQVFVQEIISDAAALPRKRYGFAVTLKTNDQLVGGGELNIHSVTNQTAEIGYIIHPAYWGQGIATDVARLLIDYGFKGLGMHRIYATCDPRNTGSERVLRKVGMQKEGQMRETILISDGWRDSMLFSVLRHEWK
nr:GNAT family protein [Aureibacillus halotolerans]